MLSSLRICVILEQLSLYVLYSNGSSIFFAKEFIKDFPHGPVVKNLLANARAMVDPWSRKIPHATGQLSLCTTTTEARTV